MQYAFTKDGGFVAGDPVTGATSYAYRTSKREREARRDPYATAYAMLTKGRPSYSGAVNSYVAAIVEEYDARNWATLDAINGTTKGLTLTQSKEA